MAAALKVIQPGLQTTVQDLGRIGHQKLGIPVSGALDTTALRAANIVVGNAPDVAGLEMVMTGPTLEVVAESVRVAVAGGSTELQILVEGVEPRRIGPLQSTRLVRGERLRIATVTGSAVAYLAIAGGLDIAPFLGSRSTYVRGGFGGLDGRALREGDTLPLGTPNAAERPEMRLTGLPLLPLTSVRLVLGPQDDEFTAAALATLTGTEYTVTREADRMGLRLDGARLDHTKGHNIVSDGIAPGAIQVPGNGLPIVLLADRQSTGGYPKIATVISADLPGLGRASPGARLRFLAVSVAAAEAARRQLEAGIKEMARRLEPVRSSEPDLDRLLSANLISGVIDAEDPAA
ncbi:MAG: biotin-dependent carboxyltransferase family protein [Hyphomicrobiaceae bacterium]